LTVLTSVASVAYAGTGTVSLYPYGFKIMRDQDLVVTHVSAAGVQTPLILNVNYNVFGAGADGGGSVLLLAGSLPVGESVILERVIPLTQETDLRNQGDFFPEVHETVFDRLVMMIQQLKALVIAVSSPSIPEFTTATKPAASAAYRLRLIGVKDPGGVMTLEVCFQRAAPGNNYEWVIVAQSTF